MAQKQGSVADGAEELERATERARKAEQEVARLREQISGDETDDGQQGSASPVRSGSTAGQRSTASIASEEKEQKQPPSPSSAGEEQKIGGGEEELRKDSMMAHLLDSLAAGEDIGHYGRLVFAMVARHFLSHEDVVRRLTRDHDFRKEDAELMLRQTEGRDYSPPRRERILEWQSKQEFPILPNAEDPDCGNLYRNLKFPDEVYTHIGHYQEQKREAGE